MPMYNLLEYSDNNSTTSGSLWNYYRDEMNDNANENNDAGNYGINNNKKKTACKSKYKTKIIGSTLDDDNKSDTEDFFPLKYLINFWRSFDLSLINCEIELDLS